ncbi:MAG TPA: patatin-like phospholipase family protein [Candidatus Acidoferrales bacterium]|nr:patatin-like phospholipase family protein [Candidatus Acidoferrales bacterium]
MQPWRRRFLLLYMMRVPLTFLTVLGFGLPWAFQSAMFHGIADLDLVKVGAASFLASLYISAAISGCFMMLLYGEERADGWANLPAPQDRVSSLSVALLYFYGGICYARFLISIGQFMGEAGRVEQNLLGGFLFYSATGLLAGFLAVMICFLAALRFAKPEDDDALEVFAFPAFLIFRRLFGGAWIRVFKRGKCSEVAPGSYAAHDGPISGFLASLLGPGYGTGPTSGHPSVLHSGHRFATMLMIFFLFAYWLTGFGTFRELKDLQQWGSGGAPNSVLNYLLLLLVFWNCLLTGLTFFVDHFRFPALAALAIFLVVVASFGSSDHVFSTVERTNPPAKLLRPDEAFQRAPEAVIVVAAAGGGIQSAAWTSRVLCGLRAKLPGSAFQKSIVAISGVSGGSVGTMFYLRCLEGPENDERPAKWAQDSSLEAVAWGLTHPDLRRIFFPGPATRWSIADRGWALERSLLKSAHFERTERRLGEPHADWPVILLNSTDARTGDPIVFTDSDFPETITQGSSNNHYFRNFHHLYSGKDVFLETAARMSATFPYVTPEARPNEPANGVHFGDGGYFDNSGVFTLSEWLKEASRRPSGTANSSISPMVSKKRILVLQLEAFPDTAPADVETPKKWYYQLTSPITTMLTVRSEGQLVRDKTAGEDLQKLLNGDGYQTTWLLVRYTPAAVTLSFGSVPCAANPPLSWHLTIVEKRCIDQAWKEVSDQTTKEISDFLKGQGEVTDEECKAGDRNVAAGVFERRCPAMAAQNKR